jgi:hypothetical protein
LCPRFQAIAQKILRHWLLDVDGNSLIAHHTSEHHNFCGLIVPTHRRILNRNEKGIADHSFRPILLEVSTVR